MEKELQTSFTNSLDSLQTCLDSKKRILDFQDEITIEIKKLKTRAENIEFKMNKIDEIHKEEEGERSNIKYLEHQNEVLKGELESKRFGYQTVVSEDFWEFV